MDDRSNKHAVYTALQAARQKSTGDNVQSDFHGTYQHFDFEPNQIQINVTLKNTYSIDWTLKAPSLYSHMDSALRFGLLVCL